MKWLSSLLLLIVKGLLLVVFDIVDGLLILFRRLFERKNKNINKKEEEEEKKTVVVVGGSFGGLQVLKGLEEAEHLNVILIDQREYYEYKPGVLSLFCHPERFNSLSGEIADRLDDNNKNNSFVLGSVVQVEEDHVIVETNNKNDKNKTKREKIFFNYLVWATGLEYPEPVSALEHLTTREQRQKDWDGVISKIKGRKVLILGGGPVGCELAGELLTTDPDQSVVLVDAHSSLLHLFPDATIDYVEWWLKERGAEVVLGQRIKKWGDDFCVLADGTRIEADVVFVCFGGKPNTQPFASSSSSFIRKCLNSRGFIDTNNFLQVPGAPHIFAVGDVLAPRNPPCSPSPFPSPSPSLSSSPSNPSSISNEMKQALYAEMSGKIAAKNIKTLSASSSSLLRYPEDLSGSSLLPLVYVISLGSDDGSLGFNTLVMNGFLAAVMKFIIEDTKVREMRGRPLGEWVWWIGDHVSFFISRTFIFPPPKKVGERRKLVDKEGEKKEKKGEEKEKQGGLKGGDNFNAPSVPEPAPASPSSCRFSSLISSPTKLQSQP
eukprot:CAMPEP_0201515152 /NCGR_PEP_ID=MMETSP0161_2-20130828/6800_1 /ASSEMBLY_ACC=CAM_ASM_000251 /TAXON_ID=180227 /ORGANISM="Neoparamoeba aestuarina, Strain SoJaBio B1-5/56/2" /LENGTH=546 /DNA_ID=CAMNT_0047911901 /DNA_START=104 /DNA_END=1741 /DNA_ORIENTATION=+